MTGRGRDSGDIIGNATGLGHGSGRGPGDDRGIIGAIDGDGHQLRRAIDGGDDKAIGQRVADIEHLHGSIAVVQCVGPDAGRRQRVAAVAVGA